MGAVAAVAAVQEGWAVGSGCSLAVTSPRVRTELPRALTALVFNPSCSTLAAAAGRDLTFLQLSSTDQLEPSRARTPKRITCLSAHPLSGFIAGSANGDVYFLSSHQPHSSSLLCAHTASAVTSVACSHNLLASGDHDGRIRVSRLPSSDHLGAHVIESFCLSHDGAVTSLAWLGAFANSCDSNLLLSSASNSEHGISAWDPLTGALLACAYTNGPVQAMCPLSSNSLLVLSGDADDARQLSHVRVERGSAADSSPVTLVCENAAQLNKAASSLDNACADKSFDALVVTADGESVFHLHTQQDCERRSCELKVILEERAPL